MIDTIIKIKGHGKAVAAATWLKSKKWNYHIQLVEYSPFSDIYNIIIPNEQEALMFKLKWGMDG